MNCESRYTVCSLPTLKGFSGYQCPWNLSRRAFSSSSPNILTRRLGNLLYRYEMTKFKATCISICILVDIICNLMPSSSFPLFLFVYLFWSWCFFFVMSVWCCFCCCCCWWCCYWWVLGEGGTSWFLAAFPVLRLPIVLYSSTSSNTPISTLW